MEETPKTIWEEERCNEKDYLNSFSIDEVENLLKGLEDENFDEVSPNIEGPSACLSDGQLDPRSHVDLRQMATLESGRELCHIIYDSQAGLTTQQHSNQMISFPQQMDVSFSNESRSQRPVGICEPRVSQALCNDTVDRISPALTQVIEQSHWVRDFNHGLLQHQPDVRLSGQSALPNIPDTVEHLCFPREPDDLISLIPSEILQALNRVNDIDENQNIPDPNNNGHQSFMASEDLKVSFVSPMQEYQTEINHAPVHNQCTEVNVSPTQYHRSYEVNIPRPDTKACPTITRPGNVHSLRKKKRSRRCLKLWHFLLHLLENRRDCAHVIRWIDRRQGIFIIEQPNALAELWGERKNKPKMVYEHVARAVRHYYDQKIIIRVPGKKLVYQFDENADMWRAVLAGEPVLLQG